MTRFVFLSLMIISAPIAVYGQQAANATLTGTITDQMGAAVASTKITATQIATGVTRDAITNDDGLYVFSNMTPGDYALRLEPPKGFAPKVTNAVSLNVGHTVTLNLQLEVDAALVMTDPIIQGPPLIDKSNSVIDGLIMQREVESLPL